MNRRDFGKKSALVATVAMIAPKILAEETKKIENEDDDAFDTLFPSHAKGPYEHRLGCNHFWTKKKFMTVNEGYKIPSDFDEEIISDDGIGTVRILLLKRDDEAYFQTWFPIDRNEKDWPVSKIDRVIGKYADTWFLDAVMPSKYNSERTEKSCPIHWEAV